MAQSFWLRADQTVMGGGALRHSKHGNEVTEVDLNQGIYLVGWYCVKEGHKPGDHQYECYEANPYFRFDVIALSGVNVIHSNLWIYTAGGYSSGDVQTVNNRVWGRSYKDDDEFPFDPLEADDWSTDGWTDKGTICTINGMTVGDTGWESLSLTSSVQTALDASHDWFGIRLRPSDDSPTGWDYTTAPDPWQRLWGHIYGAGATMEYSTYRPTNFPGYYCQVVPWLEIYFDTGGVPSQPIPGDTDTTPSTVNCVAACKFTLVALAGTASGKLWYTPNGGQNWIKVFQVEDDEITDVYIDVEHNLQNYPNNAIAWFGTSGGDVYKSINSFVSWTWVCGIFDSVVEIRGSELDSKKVVVGGGNKLHTTKDGGNTWSTKVVS